MACLARTARMQARDDLAEMLCKRVASIVKKAKAELEEIRLGQRAVTEHLIGTYRTVLENLDPGGESAAREPGQGPARAMAAIEEAGGFAAQLADIEEVTAYQMRPEYGRNGPGKGRSLRVVVVVLATSAGVWCDVGRSDRVPAVWPGGAGS